MGRGLRSPYIKDPQLTPALSNFRFWEPPEATWLGEDKKGTGPSLRRAHQGNQVSAMLSFIPRFSLMGSISICGTGAWSSSPWDLTLGPPPAPKERP